MSKPAHASEYDPSQVERVRATCLTLATQLGDLVDDIVIVGGLVPSLLVEQARFEDMEDRHVGTMDLDLGLAVSLLTDQRYHGLTERLREGRFKPDVNEDGRSTRQRWTTDGPTRVTVDFLIAPTRPSDEPGRLKSIQKDFAAFIAPGLNLAFADRVLVRLQGRTLRDELATRDVWVAGPAAFVVLKALTFRRRGAAGKDAYDLFYVLRHFGGGLDDIARRLEPHANDPSVREALTIFADDFSEVDALGE